MFVYIWKRPDNTLFYVGTTKTLGRTNPLNAGNRNWLCTQVLDSIGRQNVVIEVRHVDTLENATALEQKLILEFGRVQLATGPLTNLRPGGEGVQTMPQAAREAMSKRMRENNPVHRPEVRAKIKARMDTPEMKEKMLGDNNTAKRPEVREKLKAKWQDPEYKEAQRLARTGLKKHTDKHKEELRQKLLNPDNPMREYHKVLNTDPTIRAKRTATLQNPEVRARISAGLKAKWAERKAAK